MVDISELTGKISALKAFKDQILVAIRDEQEAQQIYNKMMAQADKAGARADSSQIRGIRDQEHDHENKFKAMLKNTEASIAEFERKVKDERRQKEAQEEIERRKKEQDDRRKREEEQRKRAAPLSEGYYGPYACPSRGGHFKLRR